MMTDSIRLGDVAEIRLSNVDKKTKPGQKCVRLCNFVDVYNNWAITERVSKGFMTASATNGQISKFQIHQGNVTITKDSETRDDIGMSALVSIEMDNTLLGYHCALIIPKIDCLDGGFLNAFLNTRTARKYFENFASGSGQRYTLTSSSIEDIRIPNIPLPTQRIIGDFFATVNEKIEADREIENTLHNLSNSLFDHWFFAHESKSIGTNAIQTTQDGWATLKLGDFLQFRKGKIPMNLSIFPPNEDYLEYLTIDSVNNRKHEFCISKDMPIVKGETIMVMDGAASGDVYLGFDGVLGSTFSMVSSARPDISNSLVFQILQKVKPAYVKATTGSTVPHTNKNFILRIPFRMPNDSRYFSNSLDKINKQITNARNERIYLENIRTSLLPLLINGQAKFCYDEQ